MVAPAPLDVLRAKLTSPNPQARLVALRHLRRHGAAASALASDVAERLRDDDPAVARYVYSTFSAVGVGSAEAATVLASMLEDDDRMRMDRALMCLAKVGPKVGATVLRAVKRKLGDATYGAYALEAAMQIAPADEEVRSALLAALYDDDYAAWSAAARHLDHVEQGLQQWGFDRVEERLDATAHRNRSAELLVHLLHVDAARSIRLALALLDDSSDEVVKSALFALRQGEANAGVARVVALLTSRPTVALPAAEVLAAWGEAAAPASEALLVLFCATDDPRERGTFASAVCHLPPSKAWSDALRRELDTRLGGDAMPQLYPLRSVARALARVGVDETETRPALRQALQRALRWWDTDRRYQVRDFLRSALEGIAARGCAYAELVPDVLALLTSTDLGEELVPVLRAIAVDEAWRRPVVDAGLDPDFALTPGDEEEPLAELPPLPDDEVPSYPELAELAEEERLAVREAIQDGTTLVQGDGAAQVAAVRRWAHAAGDEEDAILMGALWGEAVVRAAGWRWCVVVHNDDRLVAVASPDGAHACMPIVFVRSQRGRADNTVELLFNMIVSGRLPPATPGRVQLLS